MHVRTNYAHSACHTFNEGCPGLQRQQLDGLAPTMHASSRSLLLLLLLLLETLQAFLSHDLQGLDCSISWLTDNLAGT